MIQTNKLTDNAVAYKDDRYLVRYLDAHGDVQKAIIDREYRAADWTVTATGTSPVTSSVVPGAAFLITSGGSDFDGDNMQLLGTHFKLQAGKPLYFGAKITINEATQSDLVVGLAGTDTTLTAASSAHALNIGAGAVVFSKLDNVTQTTFKTFTTATETNTANVGTMDTDSHVYEFFYDGSVLTAYLDNVQVAVFTSVPTDVLTPSINFRTGSGAAKTCTVHWLRAIQVV